MKKGRALPTVLTAFFLAAAILLHLRGRDVRLHARLKVSHILLSGECLQRGGAEREK